MNRKVRLVRIAVAAPVLILFFLVFSAFVVWLQGWNALPAALIGGLFSGIMGYRMVDRR